MSSTNGFSLQGPSLGPLPGTHQLPGAFTPPTFDLSPARFELWTEPVAVGGEKYRFDDGPWQALHDYGPLYAVRGGYETLVQVTLQCQSPRVLATQLADVAGGSLGALRILDIGAGNGVSGEHLWLKGARHLVGVDREPQAELAAERDRPGLYRAYLLDIEFALRRIREDGLDCLTSVGALGSNHVPTAVFDELWAEFPPGSLLALTVPAFHKEFLTMIDGRAFRKHTEVREPVPFGHRLTMAETVKPPEQQRLVEYFCITGRKKAVAA